MVNRFEMPAENMPSRPQVKPEKGDVKRAVSAKEFWAEEAKRPSQDKPEGYESPHDAMKRIHKGTEAAASRAESIREITDGIKRRFNDWRIEDLHKLDRHLLSASMIRHLNSTFDEGFPELVAACEEGTETGRVWRNEKGEERTRISRNPDVTSRALIDRVPWIVNHDNAKLGLEAGKIISLKELSNIVRETLSEYR